MKKTKRLASVILALAMVFAMVSTAMAAEKIDNQTNHTYDAYQIFAATSQNGDGGALGDITWGNGIKKETFLPALQDDSRFEKKKTDGETVAVNVFADCGTAMDVAKALADNAEMAEDFADLASAHVTTTAKTPIPAEETVELDLGYWLLLDTSTPDVADAKNAALLQVVKNGDLTIEKKYDVPSVEKTVDDNDANIGDTVSFTLTGTMPSRLDGYQTYKVVFHDTMSQGLTYANTLTVEIDGEKVTDSFTVAPNPPVAAASGETIFTVGCDDVLALGAKESSKIVVTYQAVLNEKAIIGTDGNPNKVELEYSNDPTNKDSTGETKESEVKVFTWEIPVAKVDGKRTPLTGAEFSLYRDENCTTAVDVVATETAGIYKVCTKDDYADSHKHIITITTDSNGKLQIEGLEQGTYYLKETKAPAGYNLLTDAIKVVIGADGALTADDAETTTSEVVVENRAGTVLPETGGIGTTIFYAVGGIVVLVAIVLLITKKRMASEE